MRHWNTNTGFDAKLEAPLRIGIIFPYIHLVIDNEVTGPILQIFMSWKPGEFICILVLILIE